MYIYHTINIININLVLPPNDTHLCNTEGISRPHQNLRTIMLLQLIGLPGRPLHSAHFNQLKSKSVIYKLLYIVPVRTYAMQHILNSNQHPWIQCLRDFSRRNIFSISDTHNKLCEIFGLRIIHIEIEYICNVSQRWHYVMQYVPPPIIQRFLFWVKQMWIVITNSTNINNGVKNQYFFLREMEHYWGVCC